MFLFEAYFLLELQTTHLLVSFALQCLGIFHMIPFKVPLKISLEIARGFHNFLTYFTKTTLDTNVQMAHT